MWIVDNKGKYIEVDPEYTDIKETDEGCVVTYTIIKEYTSEQETN